MGQGEVVRGTCRLCQNECDLHLSHFLSAGVYRRCREPGQRDPNPIIISDGRAFTTSDQAQAHLLCRACERRFDEQGERWTLKVCYQLDQTFSVRDMLLGTFPVFDQEGTKGYSCEAVPDILLPKLVYFGMSIFWRATVNGWKIGKHPIPPIELGPFEADVRRYLLGGPFPEKASILINVLRSDYNASGFPYGGRQNKFHHYRFVIPGISFDLFIGGGITSTERAYCAAHSNRIYMSAVMEKMLITEVASSIQQAQTTSKVEELFQATVRSGRTSKLRVG